VKGTGLCAGCPSLCLAITNGLRIPKDKPEVQYPIMSVCQAGVKHNMC